VAERIIAFLTAHEGVCKWMTAWRAEDIRAQAAASTQRFAQGRPLSVLDGEPGVSLPAVATACPALRVVWRDKGWRRDLGICMRT
jgi:hypothetical protein